MYPIKLKRKSPEFTFIPKELFIDDAEILIWVARKITHKNVESEADALEMLAVQMRDFVTLEFTKVD